MNRKLKAGPARGRSLPAAVLALGLALGCAGARAQTGPQPAPATKPLPKNITYYLDGKVVSQAAFASVKPDDIQSIDVVKSAADRRKLGLPRESDGAVLVTTKAHANAPAVVEFNSRFPKQPATAAQDAAVAAVQAYMKQHYPAAKLEMVGMVPDKADRYQAVYEENGKRWQLFFDGEGHVIAQ